jgi:hypothetical protein
VPSRKRGLAIGFMMSAVITTATGSRMPTRRYEAGSIGWRASRDVRVSEFGTLCQQTHAEIEHFPCFQFTCYQAKSAR